MRTSTRTSAATAAATFVAMAGAIALAAPGAGAVVTGLQIQPGQSFGSAETHGTGCSYTLVASTEPGQEVVFVDQVGGAEPTTTQFQPAVVTADASGKARTTWIPDRKGQHTLWVVEYFSEEEFDPYRLDNPLTVGTGINIGPSCLVLP